MSGQELVSIIFTAIVGFVVGVFIYFSGWIDLYGVPSVQTQAEIESFTLVSEVYGGCGSECPSFRITADGSYRYLFTPAIGEDQIAREGTIPRRLQRELRDAMNKRSLEAQSFEIEPSYCNSYNDGIDVIYRITYQGTEYEIDTCGTAIDTNSQLWSTLVKIWNYFETGEV